MSELTAKPPKDAPLSNFADYKLSNSELKCYAKLQTCVTSLPDPSDEIDAMDWPDIIGGGE